MKKLMCLLSIVIFFISQPIYSQNELIKEAKIKIKQDSIEIIKLKKEQNDVIIKEVFLEDRLQFMIKNGSNIKLPQISCGDLELYIKQNLKLPEMGTYGDNKIVGEIIVCFIINRNGLIDNIEVISYVFGNKIKTTNLNNEVISLIKKLPKSISGKLQDNNINIKIKKTIILQNN
jgi:hypothetical protein